MGTIKQLNDRGKLSVMVSSRVSLKKRQQGGESDVDRKLQDAGQGLWENCHVHSHFLPFGSRAVYSDRSSGLPCSETSHAAMGKVPSLRPD